MLSLTLTFLASALVGWLITLPVVWALKVLKAAQVVREEGPSSHRGKTGTPTMAGIGILLTILIFALVLINVDLSVKYLALLALTGGYALLGFLDDAIKIKNRRNKGLLASEKVLGQVLFAILFAAVLLYLGYADQVTGALKDLHLNNPYLYLAFVVLVIVGASNAVNLTDGLDGLAAGTLGIAFIALGIVAYSLHFMDEALIAAVAGGASLSFLRFNSHPAEVFMGDVGSLGLGALLGGLAVLLHKELLLILIGGVFVAEALSVIVQVVSYKLFEFRVFRMSPLHHHFELLGASERVISASFYAAAAVFAALGIWLYDLF